ncbi:MAG TPA: glycosyltransferase [Acidimicrobiia bacterium]|nr:glycosyltransferase [Acidimicrobiia bacterium]
MSSSRVSSPTDRVRVLVLIKGLGIGGAETLIAESVSHWDRARFDYQVAYLLPWKDQLVERLEGSDVTVNCLEWVGAPGARVVGRLRRLARSFEPDIVHSHLPAAGILARLALTGTRHVYTEHNVVSSYRPVTRRLNWATYARNRAVIAVSEAVAASVEGYPGPSTRVVPNGVSVQVTGAEATAARTELGLKAEDPLIVHVGNIRPHKGHATLVEAVGYLMRKIPAVTVASIGGEKHPGDLQRVRDMATASGVADRIRFLGRRADARAFIAAADLVVNPADVEGLPVSLLEALALGRPVVATAVGGVPSVIRHEMTGLLVPPGEPESLAEAMARALGSPQAIEWGRVGARLVRREFGLDRMVTAYERIYEEVVHA